MAIGNLERLLEELGQMIGVPGLKPDVNNSCMVMLPNGVGFQIELDDSQEHLLIGFDLGDIPPGAYREMLFKAALQDNATPSSHFGVFAYTEGLDHLILWKYMPATSDAGPVAEVLRPMISKAALWVEAIANGEVPALTGKPPELDEEGGMFGIRM